MGCYFHFCPCQEARPSLNDDDIKREIKKREKDELQKGFIPETRYFKENKYGSVVGGINLKTT